MSQKAFTFSKLNLARILMMAAILLIAVFQAYWLNKLYRDEKEGLAKETDNIFRETVYNLQVDRLKNDTLFYRAVGRPNLFVYNAVNIVRDKLSGVKKDSTKKAMKDSGSGGGVIFIEGHDKPSDTTHGSRRVVFSGPGGAPMPKEVLERMIMKQMEEKGEMDSAARRRIMSRLNGISGMKIEFREGPSIRKDSFPPPEIQKNVVIQRMKEPLPEKKTPDARATVKVRFDSGHPEKAFVRLLNDGRTISDTVSVNKLDSAYRKELAKNNITLGFRIRMGKDDAQHRKDTAVTRAFSTRPSTVGLLNPHWYQAEFANPASFLLRKITPQILFSVFLIAFTTAAFIFLYRNLASQRRLTEMKNDFISNITHELKTPIATVSVAVEALRNFGGIQSPERTKEYLDISASELQRLGLLVDKVLKLSLFENRELDLKKEPVDLKELLQEVLNTMKLQFEKCHATIHLEIQGHYFLINADRLHITSVIYNLLDNALKYSKEKPDITVQLKHDTDFVVLAVADKGIGIPAGFTGKIFDKFFRVPTGDHHNIKGYGLGLSYVSHVVNRHGGSIGVESEPGKGSTFTVKLPIA